MTATTATVPALSQIQAWNANHLQRAAMHWTQTAATWEHAFTDVHHEALAPGGTTWLGAAADAAALRTGLDRVAVARAADCLHAAAAAARHGVDDIDAARRLAQQAIDSARAAGFEVTEDLSAIDRQLGGSPAQHIVREAEAQAHASAIRMRAGSLFAVDADVARKLVAAIDGLERLEFDDTAIAPRNEKPVIQAVDYAPIPDAPIKDPGVPDDPVGKGPGPTGAEIWSVIDKLPQGNRPFVREVRSAEDLQRLWNWMKEDGAAITDSYREPGKGVELILPDGTRIGQRLVAGSTGKPVLDARVPGKEYLKVHINPRGGTPELPATPRPQAEPPRPTPQTPTERGGGLPARVFGGGVLPDNTLPHFIEPPQTKESPVIGDGIPDPER